MIFREIKLVRNLHLTFLWRLHGGAGGKAQMCKTDFCCGAALILFAISGQLAGRCCQPNGLIGVSGTYVYLRCHATVLLLSANLPNRGAVISKPDAQLGAASALALAEREHLRSVDQFLRTHERKALRMAELSTRQHPDALDLVQETMIGFVKNYAAQANKTAPVEDWSKLFYTVLDSRLMDWHRRQSVRNRFRAVFGLKPSEQEPSVDPLQSVADEQLIEPDRQTLSAQTGPAINAALAELPERQRQAFLLRIWHGFDVAQTAEIMRCSQGSVKTHLSRALERLRELLVDLEK